MVGESFRIRPAGTEDVPFLTDMLIEAVNWCPGRELDRGQILSRPDLAHYVTGWPREGERGVIAEASGVPIGAAWLRLMPTHDPGYGFVAPDVPELSIAVVAAWRGHGVGRALLRAAAAQARAAGAARISLSVERANPAKALYEDEGFRVLSRSPNAGTMILDLPTADPPATRHPIPSAPPATDASRSHQRHGSTFRTGYGWGSGDKFGRGCWVCHDRIPRSRGVDVDKFLP